MSKPLATNMSSAHTNTKRSNTLKSDNHTQTESISIILTPAESVKRSLRERDTRKICCHRQKMKHFPAFSSSITACAEITFDI